MSLVTKPYVFVAGATIASVQVNADFDTLYSVVNGNLDNTNIGSAGLFASQIIPTSGAQAAFGGSAAYQFPAGLGVTGQAVISGELFAGSASVSGPIGAATTSAGVQAYVPPVYNAGGSNLASTTHIVCGSATMTFAGGSNVGSSSVTFLSTAAFAALPVVLVTISTYSGAITGPVAVIVSSVATNGFVVTGIQGGTAAGTATVTWFAIGA